MKKFIGPTIGTFILALAGLWGFSNMAITAAVLESNGWGAGTLIPAWGIAVCCLVFPFTYGGKMFYDAWKSERTKVHEK